MNRRALLIAAIALLIVLLAASFTTAWARQVSLDSKTHDRALVAQSAVTLALKRAADDGLRPGELAPYRRSLRKISRQVAPSALPFWSSHLMAFYTRQISGYHRLIRAIHAGEERVTVQARGAAEDAVRRLGDQIRVAKSLGVPADGAQAVLRQARVILLNSRLPRQYRAIPAAVTMPSATLAAANTVRRAQIDAILSAAHHSRSGVVRRAHKEVAGVQAQLSLLGFLTPRAGAYRVVLAQVERRIQAQPTALAAAVREYSLDQEIARVAADYRRTVPQKMIVVSTEKQAATLFQTGHSIYQTPVTTGGPELPTDHGVFHMYLKITPWVFHSPWPPGSPYYYVPTPVTYWMPFDGGEGLHDAWWRSNFGPGSNYQLTNLGDGNYILGTHGCVNLPFAAAQYIWDWAPVGTTVVVI